METALLFIWILLFILHTTYKMIYQYRGVGNQPYAYRTVKKILSYGDLFTLLITVGVFTSVSLWYLVLIPISLGSRYIINFLCFKRESDRLYKIYVHGGMKHENALETANETINRKIEDKELF